MSLRDHRVAKAGHEYALVEEQLAHTYRLGRLPQDHWDNRRLARQRLESEPHKLVPEVSGVLSQSGHELGMVLDVADGRQRTPCHGAREGVRKELGSGALSEVISERGGAGRGPPRSTAPRLAPAGRGDVHVAEHPVVIGRAAARGAEYAGGMRVVHRDDRVVL